MRQGRKIPIKTTTLDDITLFCMKFGHLILRKIIITGWQIFRLKCTKFDFGWGSAQTPLGEFAALPQTL